MKNLTREERADLARSFFKQGFNCSQSVVLAYEDAFEGVSREQLLRLSGGFGGGMGRMREVCGCVSGMVMVSGQFAGAPDPSDHNARTQSYALVQKLAGEFKAVTGSIICRELLEGTAPHNHVTSQESPEPAPRTEEYYKKRPCLEMCALAAGILADNLDNGTSI